MFVAAFVESYLAAFVVTLVPVFTMWNITFISGELEQPFGKDACRFL